MSKSKRQAILKLKLGVLILAAAGSLAAQTGPATDFSDVEDFLNQGETARRQTIATQLHALTSELTPLLSNNLKLLDAYKDAYANVFFEGAKKEHSKVKEWEERNKAVFKEEGFSWALRAHVQYLLATLAKRAGEDEAAMKQTLDWLDAFPRAPDKYEKIAKQELLIAGVANSVFLRATNRTGLVQGLQNWHLGDLTNVSEMHRINVIACLRSKKDLRVFDQWKANLKLEQETAERERLAAKREYFALHRRPWLLWQVGKDYAFYGQHRPAVEVMVQALKESPKCDDYDRIVAEIRRVIAEARKAVAAP